MSSTENVNFRMNVSSRKTTVMSSEYRVGDGDAKSGEQKGRYCSSSADGKESCWVSSLIRLIVCVLAGVIFGIALHKAHGRRICSLQFANILI